MDMLRKSVLRNDFVRHLSQERKYKLRFIKLKVKRYRKRKKVGSKVYEFYQNVVELPSNFFFAEVVVMPREDFEAVFSTVENSGPQFSTVEKIDMTNIKIRHYVKSLKIISNPKWAFNSELKEWFRKRTCGRVLHVCCGHTRFENSINVDIDPSASCDVLADMFNLPFRSGVFDTYVCDPPYRLAINRRVEWVFEAKRILKKKVGAKLLLKTDFIPFFGQEFTLKEIEIYTGKRWWVPISLLLNYELKGTPNSTVENQNQGGSLNE